MRLRLAMIRDLWGKLFVSGVRGICPVSGAPRLCEPFSLGITIAWTAVAEPWDAMLLGEMSVDGYLISERGGPSSFRVSCRHAKLAGNVEYSSVNCIGVGISTTSSAPAKNVNLEGLGSHSFEANTNTLSIGSIILVALRFGC
ncbi:hypothetical protein C8R47DRAFT_658595 [Mycena vitilis]|nr:hypothetical protein C8R47DRAFT_658595 [Mycena vitilis]